MFTCPRLLEAGIHMVGRTFHKGLKGRHNENLAGLGGKKMSPKLSGRRGRLCYAVM